MSRKHSTTGLLLCAFSWLATPAKAIELQAFDHPYWHFEESRNSQPSWSPNGEYLAYIGEWQPDPTRMSSSFLRAANFDGGYLTWLPLVRYGPDPLNGISSPTWSPDGKRMAYICYIQDGATGIWTVGESSTPALLLSRPVASCAWSPSGDTIAFVEGGSLWLITLDTRAIRLLRTGINSKPSWSPDGRSIVFSAGNTGLWVLDIATSALRQLTTNPMDREPAWSPNGHWIAFSTDYGGQSDIWVVHASGGGAIPVTFDAHWDDQPAWSPSGDRIAFYSLRDHPNLWQGGIWIASQLPDVVTQVAPRSWSTLKTSYR